MQDKRRSRFHASDNNKASFPWNYSYMPSVTNLCNPGSASALLAQFYGFAIAGGWRWIRLIVSGSL